MNRKLIQILNITISIILLFYFFYITNRRTQELSNKEYKKEIGKFNLYLSSKDMNNYKLYEKNIKQGFEYWDNIILNDVNINIYMNFENFKSTYIVKSKITKDDLNNLTSDAELKINTCFFKQLDNNQQFNVMRHEICHLLGVGNKWEITYKYDKGNYLDKNKYPLTYTAYKEITSVDPDLGVPIENNGGKGIENNHWENEDRYFGNIYTLGLRNELMTSILEDEKPLSKITINNLKDMGWSINVKEEFIDFTIPNRLNPIYI